MSLNSSVSFPKLRTILVEDELAARKTLNGLIREYTPDIQVVAEATTVREGIESISAHKPDLIFLDMELRGEYGLKVLEYSVPIDFEVIITTAHNQFALNSYDYGVADYLLKPIAPSQIKRAVARVMERVQLKYVASRKDSVKMISVPVTEGIRYLQADQIIRLEAARNYTWFYLENEKPILISKTLSFFDEQMLSIGFLRVHHSHVVNPLFVKEYVKHTSDLYMKDNSIVPVSREKRKQLTSLL